MKYEYDIAISYKSEIAEKAAKINDYLIKDGWKIFFAPAKQQELLSEKIHQMLYGIYKNNSFMKVLLISEGYLEGEWTSLEKRVSLESTKKDRKRLLIVNYTDQLILPGELQSLQYLDGRKYKEDEIASLITERLKISMKQDSKKKNAKKKQQNTPKSITINTGVIAGDNAHIKNIKF